MRMGRSQRQNEGLRGWCGRLVGAGHGKKQGRGHLSGAKRGTPLAQLALALTEQRRSCAPVGSPCSWLALIAKFRTPRSRLTAMLVSHVPSLLVLVVAILIASCGSGCSLVPRSGTVTPELAAARRLSNEALAAADRSDLIRAEGLLEQAVKSCPQDVDARQHYADVLWRRGLRTEAVTQMDKALALAPDNAALCVEAGGMYLDLGLFGEADRLASQAVRLDPGSAAAWHLRGRVALARGQPEPALADFHRALAIVPGSRSILLDTAEAYRQLDRPQRALATLAILGETYGPGDLPASVLVLEGLAQEALGRSADAAESYRQALAAGDAPAEAAARLAALEQQGGKVLR